MTDVNTPDWSAMLALSTPQFKLHEVNKQKQAFYPVSMTMLFRLRDVATPVSQALSILFSPQGQDSRKEIRQTSNTEADGSTTSAVEDVQEPVSLEVTQYRDMQRRDAIKTLFDELTSNQNMGLVGDIIISSMRDVFPPHITTHPPGLEFMSKLTADVIIEMVSGVMAANTGIFEPLVGKLVDSMKEKMKETLMQSDSVSETEKEPEPVPTAAPVPPVTPPMAG